MGKIKKKTTSSVELLLDRLTYIWTAGTKIFGNFTWPTGEIDYSNWSATGSGEAAQPDNYEEGGEDCLAVLNNFYGDGVKWHDVACHHTKPVIYERKLPA